MAAFLVAAAALSLERLCYIWIWRRPDRFRTFCRESLGADGDPIEALQLLFYVFKGLQVAVFAGWCYVYGNGSLWPPADGPGFVLGACLAATGQMLNLSVFRRLGHVGVFYGSRFGHEVPWCEEFPFSIMKHPQYVGAVLSIWGVFLIMRFPHDDWFAIPLLETAYYVLGAHLEQ